MVDEQTHAKPSPQQRKVKQTKASVRMAGPLLEPMHSLRDARIGLASGFWGVPADAVAFETEALEDIQPCHFPKLSLQCGGRKMKGKLEREALYLLCGAQEDNVVVSTLQAAQHRFQKRQEPGWGVSFG